MAQDFQGNNRLAGERGDLRHRCRKILVTRAHLNSPEDESETTRKVAVQQQGYTPNFDVVTGHPCI